MEWVLLFKSPGSGGVEVFHTSLEPQEAARRLSADYPSLRLVAAIKKPEALLIADPARTAECALEPVYLL